MKYRKKPVVIEAFKWTGGPDQAEDPIWAIKALKKDFFSEIGAMRTIVVAGIVVMEIFTLEGRMVAKQGDYIIQGIKKEIYPCKPDIFEATYEKVEQDG